MHSSRSVFNFCVGFYFAFVLLLPVHSMAQENVTNSDKFVLSGTLMEHFSVPLKLGVVDVTTYRKNSATTHQTITIDDNGKFDISLTGGDVHRIYFSSPSRKGMFLLLGPHIQTDIDMDVQLNSLDYVVTPSSVSVAISSAGKTKRYPMVPDSSGAFHFTLENVSESVRYKYHGIGMDPYGDVDPKAELYEYDENNRWRGLKVPVDNKLVFSYVPEKRQSKDVHEQVSFTGELSQELKTEILLQSKLFQIALDNYFFKHENKANDRTFELGEATIDKLLKQYTQPFLQQLIYVVAASSFPEKKVYSHKAMQLIPPESWIWHWWSVSFIDTLMAASNAYSNDSYADILVNTYPLHKEEIQKYIQHNYSMDAKAKVTFLLAWVHKEKGLEKEFNGFFDILKSKYSGVDDYEYYVKHLSEKKIRVGSVFPDFDMQSVSDEGKAYQNSTFKGRYVLMDFWGTWCPPCIKELPALEEAYQTFHDKGFDILSFNADATIEEFQNFRSGRWKMPWKHVFIGIDDDEILEYFGVMGFPTAYLVDPHGKVVATGNDVKGSNLAVTLENVMANEK